MSIAQQGFSETLTSYSNLYMLQESTHIINSNKSRSRNQRRRKKRRTQNVSDSESSSSSPSNQSSYEESEVETNNDIDVQLSDIDLSDTEKEITKKFEREGLDDVTLGLLDQVLLTKTDLTSKNAVDINNIDLNKTFELLEDNKADMTRLKATQGNMKNSYLNMLFEHYGEDINKLRDAPDFTNKSLVMLANVLKDGGDMFDSDSLKTIVD